MTREFTRHCRLVNRGGESIYAEATGIGHPIVLCHGLGGNHAIWWRQIDEMARRHNVITWDQRGFGNSTTRSGEVGIDEAAGDLIAVLDDLNVASAHFVGQSMGAFVALRAALDHPDRATSLVLSTTLAAADPRYTRALDGADSDRSRRDRHPVVSVEFSRSHTDLAVLYNLISSFGNKPPIHEMLGAMADHRFGDDELAEMRIPALFLAAGDDEFCPPSVMRDAAARLGNSTLIVLPEASHSVYYEDPQTWTAAAMHFIDAHSPISQT